MAHVELGNQSLKCTWKTKGVKITETILKNNTKGFDLLLVKAHSNAIMTRQGYISIAYTRN